MFVVIFLIAQSTSTHAGLETLPLIQATTTIQTLPHTHTHTHKF